MYKLLMVDDQREIQMANREYLMRRGYEVDVAFSSGDAFFYIREKLYDCIVLDVMLPDLDGFAFCKAARRTVETPIIFLSCLDSEEDRIGGLMAGGDDYMTKPYSLKELAARIHAQIRRDKALSGRQDGVEVPEPNVLVDGGGRTIVVNGVSLVVSKKESALLLAFIKNPEKTIGREELLRLIQGEESSLPVYIKRVREKISVDKSLGEIITVHGEGYIYRPAKEGEGAQ